MRSLNPGEQVARFVYELPNDTIHVNQQKRPLLIRAAGGGGVQVGGPEALTKDGSGLGAALIAAAHSQH